MNIRKVFKLPFVAGRHLEQFSYEQYDLIYFLTGSGSITVNGVIKPYNANDVVFMKPHQIRDQVATEECTYICIRFETRHEVSLESDVYTTTTPDIYQIFKMIFKEYEEKHHEYYELCNLKLREILVLLTRTIKEQRESSDSMLDLIREIDATLLYDCSIDDMAKKANYSYDHFRHKFKQVTGKSPYAYIQNRKMEHACALLSEQTYTCTEIAQLLGYSSSSQFCKIFKKELGVSPTLYQKYDT
ncbi:MAG: AraC family transcriptional regulator [Lachnospiraceae bacterium]